MMTKELESTSWKQWLKAYLPNLCALASWCAPNGLKLCLEVNDQPLSRTWDS